MDQERDTVVFTDEDGNDVILEVFRYFYYNGEEYAVLTDQETARYCANPPEGEIADGEADIFFVKVVPVEDSEDEVEFIPVEDEALSDKLYDIITAEVDEMDDEQ